MPKLKSGESVKKIEKSTSSSSGSPNTDVKENQQSLGQELARVLLEELCPKDFPKPRSEWTKELYSIIEFEESKKNKKELKKESSIIKLTSDSGDTLPERGGIINFQSKGGKKLPKHVFAPQVAADSNDPVELFCLSYGGFVPEGDTSIEHAYPHTKIRANQIRLLQFLNNPENKIIADAFLKVKGITNYIQRDNGKVKASLLFFKHSYGAMTNLYLMSQGENSKKGAKDMLGWIEEEGNPMLGEPFLKKVEEDGGTHAGVLFDRVYRVQPEYRKILLKTNEPPIVLPPPEAQAKGLGQTVRDWIGKIGWAIELRQAHYNQSNQPVKQHVTALLTHFENDTVDEIGMQNCIRREQVKLMREFQSLFSIQNTILGRSQMRVETSLTTSHGSSTGSNSELGACNKENIENNFQETTQINSVTHRMRSVVKKIAPTFASSVYQFIEKDLRKRSEARLLTSEDWESILKEFQEYVFKIALSDVGESKSESSKIEKMEVDESADLTVALDESKITQKIQTLFSSKLLKSQVIQNLQKQEREKAVEKEKEIKQADEAYMDSVDTRTKQCEQQINEIKQAMISIPNEITAAAESNDIAKVIELSQKLKLLPEKLEELQSNLSEIREDTKATRKRKREAIDPNPTFDLDTNSAPKSSGSPAMFGTSVQSSLTTTVDPKIGSSSPPQDSAGDISGDSESLSAVPMKEESSLLKAKEKEVSSKATIEPLTKKPKVDDSKEEEHATTSTFIPGIGIGSGE